MKYQRNLFTKTSRCAEESDNMYILCSGQTCKPSQSMKMFVILVCCFWWCQPTSTGPLFGYSKKANSAAVRSRRLWRTGKYSNYNAVRHATHNSSFKNQQSIVKIRALPHNNNFAALTQHVITMAEPFYIVKFKHCCTDVIALPCSIKFKVTEPHFIQLEWTIHTCTS